MAKPAVYCTLAILLCALFSSASAVDEQLPKKPISKKGTVTVIDDTEVGNLISTQTGSETPLSEEELQRNIKKYHRAVTELEKIHGAYHEQIGEQLIGLGSFLQNNGQYADAVNIFNRALHISRISQGLHNLNQLPIVEQIIESNTALKNWPELSKNYDYLLWVNRRAYEHNDLRLLPVIDRVGRWNLNAYEMGASEIPYGHLLIAEKLYRHAIDIIETNYGPYDPRLIDPLYGIALTNYRKAAHASSTEDIDEVRISSRAHPNEYQRMLEDQGMRQNVVSMSYRVGKKAMTRIIDIFQNNQSLANNAHAMAYIKFGDWYLLFNKRTTAIGSYEKAYQMLEQEDASIRQRLLGNPRSLPVTQLPVDQQTPRKINNSYVIASMDISETGSPENIQIIESYPSDNDSIRRQAKRTIKYTKFRPRFENGQAVATSGVNIRYLFD